METPSAEGLNPHCRIAFAILAVAVALGLRTHDTSATTVRERDLRSVCAAADLVFVGRVVDVQPARAPAGGIETRVTFGVETALRGVEASEVTLRFGGGEIEGVRDQIVGMPTFRPGDEVIVFAEENGGVSPLVGFHQGLYRVKGIPRGRVVLSADGGPVVRDETGRFTVARHRDLDRATRLEVFLTHVRAVLADSPEERHEPAGTTHSHSRED